MASLGHMAGRTIGFVISLWRRLDLLGREWSEGLSYRSQGRIGLASMKDSTVCRAANVPFLIGLDKARIPQFFHILSGLRSAHCRVERDQRTLVRRLKPTLSRAYRLLHTCFPPARALLRIKGACCRSSLRFPIYAAMLPPFDYFTYRRVR